MKKIYILLCILLLSTIAIHQLLLNPFHGSWEAVQILDDGTEKIWAKAMIFEKDKTLMLV